MTELLARWVQTGVCYFGGSFVRRQLKKSQTVEALTEMILKKNSYNHYYIINKKMLIDLLITPLVLTRCPLTAAVFSHLGFHQFHFFLLLQLQNKI